MYVFLVYLHHEPFLLQFLDDERASFFDVSPRKLPRDGKENAALVDDLLDVELVLLRELKVVCVMCGCNRHGARAERHVDTFVFYDCCGYRPVDPLKIYRLSVLVFFVPFVIGMHHDILIAKLCLRAHRADDERAILKIVKGIGLFHVLYLIVGDGRLRLRVPVHNTVAAIDKPRIEHAHERFHDRAVARFVHRVCVAAPVQTAANLLRLVDDSRFAFFGERVDAAEKFFSTEIVPRFLLFFVDIGFDFRLGRDRSGVGSGKPERPISAHSVIAYQDVFDREHRRVAHMQRSRYIRWRQDDGISFCVRPRHSFFDTYIRIRIAALLPHFQNLWLLLCRIVWF